MSEPGATTAAPGESLEGDVDSPKKIRIAIADDHPIFRDGLRELLSLEKDFEVVAEIGNGGDVLRVVEERRPDILLLDLQMPGAHGLAILERMQAAAQTRPRVIVVTASEDKNEFVQTIKLGTAGIVLKQSPTEMLFKSIRKVHAGEIWLDSHTTAAVMRQFSGEDVTGAQNGRGRSPLSQREREIVALVTQGFKNKEMAEKMFISEQTVKNHLHNI